MRKRIASLEQMVGARARSVKRTVKRKLSPKARAAIARAARKRWAEYRAAKRASS